MKSLSGILFIFWLTSGYLLYGQNSIQALDSLILSSEYEKAVNLVSSYLSVEKNPAVLFQINLKKTEALIKLGRFTESGELISTLYNQYSDLEEPEFLQALILTNLGLLQLNEGRNDLSLESLQQSIKLFETSGKSETLEAAQAWAYLGLVYMNSGKYVQAEEQLQQALRIRSGLLKGQHELIAASYNDLGLVYSQFDDRKALDFYRMAMTMYEGLHGNLHPKIAITNTNIGIIYRNLERYGEATTYFENALKIWNNVYPGTHPIKAFVLYNIADTYVKTGVLNTAEEYFNLSLRMYREFHGAKHPEIATVLNSLGNLKLTRGLYKEALHLYQSALVANISNFSETNIRINPKPENYYNGNILLYSLLFKAQALEKEYLEKTLRFSNLDFAINTLFTCDTLVNVLRQQANNETDKITLGAIANEVYTDGVRISYLASQNALKKNKYAKYVFYFAEKSKSAVLLDAISDTEAKSFAGIPTHLLEEEKKLKAELALTSQKLAMMASTEEETELRETAFELNRSYETFVRTLESEYPEYFNLKFNPATPGLEQIQSVLDSKTAILSYFIDDKNNMLYIFQTGNKNFRITERPITEDFDRAITGLRNSIYYRENISLRQTAGNLGEILIPAIPSNIRNLVIIPSGRLSVIPFEVLYRGSGKYDNLLSAPFLLKKYSLRYEFSAGLILQKRKEENNKNPAIFLCAPVHFPNDNNLSDLPGTEAEVNEISELFEARNLNVSVHINEQATESMIKSPDLKQFSYLHLATHGVVDEKSPELSRVYLQQDPGREDGNLYSGEIYNLELDADLVTLSACRTGLGKISKGEGVIGLSRALVYAGAKNLMVTFWNVSDESTAAIMKEFYRLQLDQPDIDFSENLRQAKFTLIDSGKYADPYYWAPFILIGF